MKKKGNFRKVVSGLLAGMTMLSTVLSPMTAYAAEIQPLVFLGLEYNIRNVKNPATIKLTSSAVTLQFPINI